MRYLRASVAFFWRDNSLSKLRQFNVMSRKHSVNEITSDSLARSLARGAVDSSSFLLCDRPHDVNSTMFDVLTTTR